MRAILALARSLNIEVVAEGVETESQHRFLTEQRFPVLQGYLFSPPLLPAPLEHWLTEHRYTAAVEAGPTPVRVA